MSCPIKILLVVILWQAGTIHSVTAQEQSRIKRKNFYVGLEMGVGLLELSRNNLPADRTDRFAMGFYGGYSPFRWLRAGLNLNGWLIEPFGYDYDPSKGVSIGNTFGQIELFPFRKLNFLINLEGGVSTYTNMHPDEFTTRGTGVKFGLGYEHDVARNLGLSLIVNYGAGRFNDVLYSSPVINQHYNAVEFLLGITYR